MARYTGPKSRIARKFGEGIFGADKVLSKKNYPPGQHGNSRKRKTSEYGVQLREKQKAKYTYGVLEKQFRNLFAGILRISTTIAINTPIRIIAHGSSSFMIPSTSIFIIVA